MLPSVSSDDIRSAMTRFDNELRDSDSWKNWTKDRRHRYAIEQDEKLYPVKQIVSMAADTPVSSFGGGTESNRYVESRGFTIVAVQVPTEAEISAALHDLILSRRPADVSNAEAEESLAGFFRISRQLRQIGALGDGGAWQTALWGARQRLALAKVILPQYLAFFRLWVREKKKIWLEKTLVSGRADRMEGPYALGRALWSPQRDRSDGDTYAFMREVQPGDLVLHLVDNQRIAGSSIVADYVSLDFSGIADTEWSGTDCYMVQLKDFQACDPPLERKNFLGDPALSLELREIRAQNKNLFYDRDLGLVQGFYFTTVPPALAELLNRAYLTQTGKSIPHLSEALAEGLSQNEQQPKVGALTQPGPSRQIWIYAPGRDAEHWDEFYTEGLMAIGWEELGDLTEYDSLESTKGHFRNIYDADHDPMNDARACYEFAHRIRPGDLVFAKRGRSRIVGYGTVLGDYQHDPARAYYNNVRRIRWDARGDWAVPSMMPTKVLTNITQDQERIDALLRLVGLTTAEEAPDVVPLTEREPFTIHDAMDGLFLPQGEFEQILRVWRAKKNLILQGAPGVGKTHIARRLAYALMGFRDASRVSMVQFHQSYSYEDFVQGYRPKANGLELRDGLFLEFCAKASRDPDTPHVFIIDEINRGNLSRIFGELMMLIEPDKRGSKWSVPLTYASSSEAQFSVSQNIYLLGLMNTADRSLAMVDYALRRRFAFWTIEPRIDAPAFRSMLVAKGVTDDRASKLIDLLNTINAEIASDTANLGRGYRIGHSFFCSELGIGQDPAIWLSDVIHTELLPLVSEYWVDDTAKAAEWVERLKAIA